MLECSITTLARQDERATSSKSLEKKTLWGTKVAGTNDSAYFSRKIIWTKGGRKELKKCPPADTGTNI